MSLQPVGTSAPAATTIAATAEETKRVRRIRIMAIS
jgi:hypothetical protein